jgi:hypothetical protein
MESQAADDHIEGLIAPREGARISADKMDWSLTDERLCLT